MERPRLRTRKSPALGQPLPASSERRETPVAGVAPNTGPLATAAWLIARGLVPAGRTWSVEVVLRAGASRFEIQIFAEEWGFSFHHEDRVSWIRVTDIPFVHGRDDHELLRQTTSLRGLQQLVRGLESRYELAFDREGAEVETSIENGEEAIREWIAEL